MTHERCVKTAPAVAGPFLCRFCTSLYLCATLGGNAILGVSGIVCGVAWSAGLWQGTKNNTQRYLDHLEHTTCRASTPSHQHASARRHVITSPRHHVVLGQVDIPSSSASPQAKCSVSATMVT